MTSPLDLAGRRILVTGASSGIGRATAGLLARLGARLVVHGRDEARLASLLAALPGDGHASAALDLAVSCDLNAWMADLARRGGPFAGAVHAAGTLAVRPLKVLGPEALRAAFEVNVFAAAALARGLRQKGVVEPPASLVFVSSVMGLVGQPGIAAYAATKGALLALARSLALELAREGIRVNCVAPGQVRTPMLDEVRATVGEEAFARMEAQHPLGLGEPEDVAHAVAFLLAPTGRWITGTTLVVDGGYTAG